jgi:hypothetical protein
VTLVIKCVKEGVLVTDFNKFLGGGDKSDSKAFGDYFVVRRRQKSLWLQKEKIVRFHLFRQIIFRS